VVLAAEHLLIGVSAKDPFSIIDFPYVMIQAETVRAPVTEHIGVSRVVLRIVYVSVAVHLKPFDMCLLWQTIDLPHGRKYHHLLFQLVKTELYVVIDHPVIADTTVIGVGIILVIGDIIPQPRLIRWLHSSHVQTGKVGSGWGSPLGSSMLHERQDTG